ncbi:MAG: DUF4394 domain-containing protein [Luteolibacter sp.]
MKKRSLITLLAVLAPAVMHADNKNRNHDRDRGDDLVVIGLTSDNRLVWFSEDSPKRTRNIGAISGLTGDTGLIGIDYRVQDGLLYGVGNAGGVYTLNTMTATAVKVSVLTVALHGTAFGVDFNPAADRLRIISNTGQNLRHNVNGGGTTLLDGTLTYTPPAIALGIVGAAYTNNDLDASTATTLFDLDATLDQIAAQAPANNGTLSATGKLTFDTGEVAGLDIYSTLRGGITVRNQAFAVLTVGGITGFYYVNLLTGKAELEDHFKSTDAVMDIAIPLNQR